MEERAAVLEDRLYFNLNLDGSERDREKSVRTGFVDLFLRLFSHPLLLHPSDTDPSSCPCCPTLKLLLTWLKLSVRALLTNLTYNQAVIYRSCNVSIKCFGYN